MVPPHGPWHSMSDEELLQAIARKNKDAFRELMQRYQQRIYRMAYRFTGNADSAAELTQEIFFKAYCAAPRYTPGAQVFTWLYRIAANHCLNFIRDRKNRPLDNALPQTAAPEPRSEVTPHERLEREEREKAVRQALQRLPERQRMAIMLLRFEGMSYRDIAKVLGCSVGAVESLVSRGMASLKEHLVAYKEQ